MKKSLSLILAIAMVFSMFASVAFAAETTTAPKTAQEKFDALKAKGIFEGINDAGDAGLDLDMNRAQAAKILVKLAGLTEDTAAAATFKDLEGDEEWAIGFIGAAKKGGLMEGKADGVFAPADEFTVEELATVLVRFLDLKVEANATVEGEVSDWAKGFVAAAIKAGVIEKSADYTTAASREILVNASFASYEIANKPVQPAVDAKVIGAKKIEVTFNKAVDDKLATFKVLRGTVEQNVEKVSFNEAKTVATIEMTVKFQKDEYTVEVGGVVDPVYKKTLTLEEEKIVKIDVASDKASFVRGSSNMTIEANYNVYNQYDEKVNGTPVQFNASKGKATGSDGKLTVTTVSYGDVAYMLNENVIVSAYYSDYSTNSFAQTQKTLTVAMEAKVASLEIKGLHHSNKDVPTVGETPSDFEVKFVAKDQYGNVVKDTGYVRSDIQVFASNPTLFTVGTTAADFRESDGDIFVKLAPAAGKSTFEMAGTATVTMYAINSGNNAKLDIAVEDSQKVATFTMSAPSVAAGGETIEIPFTAVDKAGKTLGKASDYNLLNNTISLSSTLDTTSPVSKKLSFRKDVVNNKVVLELDANGLNVTKEVPVVVYLNATVNPNTVDYKLASLNITLKPNAVPYTITGLADTKMAMVDGASTTVNHDDVKVVDQYNRTFAIKDKLTSYSIKVSLDGVDKVAHNGTTAKDVAITNATRSVTLDAVSKGTAKLTLKVTDLAGVAIETTAKSFNIKVVEPKDVVDFEIGAVATLFAHDGANPTDIHGADYRKDLSVTGLLADGTKAAIKTDDARLYTVTAVTYDVTYSGGKLTATPALKNGILKDSNTATGKVVISATKNGTETVFVEKEITVSKAAPEATKFEVKSTTGVVGKEGTDYVSLTASQLAALKGASTVAAAKAILAAGAVKVTDQYGVEITVGNPFTNITLSNLVDEKGDRVKVSDVLVVGDATLTNAQVGHTFTVTVATKNANMYSFKVVVKN